MGNAFRPPILAWHNAVPKHLQKVSVSCPLRAAVADTTPNPSSAHYWLLSGVLLASVLYSPAYSDYSPFIIGTARDKPRFLMGCLALWAVSPLSRARQVPGLIPCVVRRVFKPSRTSHSACSSAGRLEDAGNTVRIWLLTCFIPELLLRDPVVGGHCHNDRELCGSVCTHYTARQVENLQSCFCH